MPGMKDEGGGQPRDQWGGLLQNEYGRSMGRLEASQEQILREVRELKNEGKGRDKALAEVTERVRQNAHKAGNDIQKVSMGLEKAQVAIDTTKLMVEQVSIKVTGVDDRVAKLEEPLQASRAQRAARRARWQARLAWVAAVGVFLWGGFEPIYKTLMPVAIQRWFSITLPPH